MDLRSTIVFLGKLLSNVLSAIYQKLTQGVRTVKDTSITEPPDRTKPTRNPFRILWRYWLNVSFIINIVFAVFAIFIVVAAVGGVIVMDTEQTLTEKTESDMKHSSSLQHTQTDFWVSSMQRQSELISNSRIITSGGEEEIDAYLTDQLTNLPNEAVSIHYIQLSNTDYATTIKSTGSPAEGAPWKNLTTNNFGDRTTVLQSSTYTYTSDDSSNLTRETPVLAFTTPTHAEDDRAVVIVVNLRQASQRLSAPDDGRSFVVNNDGEIVLSTNPQDVGANAYSLDYINQDLWNQAHVETSAYATTYYDEDTVIGGERYVTSMARTDHADWVAYTQVPHSSAFALRDNIQNSMLLLISAVLFSAGIIGGIVSLPVVRDLRRLSEITQRVSAGNYDDPIVANRNDEIGQVFKEVDNMRVSLRDRINEVEDLNTKFKRIVHEQSEVMGSVSDGNLTQSMDTDTGLDALDDLAEDFNKMVSDVHEMVLELERSNEEIEQFMFVATHDLREPLRMIKTYSNLLQHEYEDSLDEEAIEYLEFITSSTNKIDIMIADFYSYLEAKTSTLEMETTSLEEVVTSAESHIEDSKNASNASITTQNSPKIQADPSQLETVFVQLLRNSIQFTPENRTPEIKITAEVNDKTQQHIITIVDNGSGINEEHIDTVFNVFEQLERDDDDEEGTGIGLSICKRIIESHGGRIWVDPKFEDVGTRIRFTLPYNSSNSSRDFKTATVGPYDDLFEE